jgi:3-phenylpropionate/trans-cinnamate dioxygenase ferredoxin reductase component
MPHYDYLIVGGGMTADAAARGIREVDPRRTIGIISAETHAPYNRPPLTKGLWKGDKPESVWRHSDETGAKLHIGRRALKVDVGMRRVSDDQRESYGYKRLLLATGGEPRRLPNSPEGVIYFRTLDDYRRTKLFLDHNARFVVLGGGFIGSEIAAALRMHGADVTMIVPEQGIGARIFPVDLAKYVTAYYRNKGIVVHAADSVEKIEANAGRFRVHAKNAGKLDADAVIAGLGIVPNVDLAKQAMLSVDNGVIVDEKLHTNQPDVFAAGDVANFMSPALGKRLRVEHEDNANTMGRIAGRNMAGADESYDHLPFFYSDLFDLGYEAVGDTDPRLQTFADWKTEFREGVVYYMEGGRVRGVLLWGIFGQVDAARALIAEPGPFSAENLKGRIPTSS